MLSYPKLKGKDNLFKWAIINSNQLHLINDLNYSKIIPNYFMGLHNETLTMKKYD